jgi:hypothetical protein
MTIIGSLGAAALLVLSLPGAPTLASGTVAPEPASGAGSPLQAVLALVRPFSTPGPALKKILPRTEHRRHKGLNNRAENPHQPTRQRERAMRRFKSPEQAQRFLEPFGPIREHCCPGRHRLSAGCYRAILALRFATWSDMTGVAA